MTATEELSDIGLVEQVVAGKPGAFATFFGRFGLLIKAAVRKRLAGTFASPNVEDVVQDFFVKLIKNEFRLLRAWQRGTSLRIFLSVAVRNHAIDYLRKNSPSDRLRDYIDLAEWFDKQQLRTETPAHALGVKQLRHAVVRACRHLKQPRSRGLLRLKLLKQLDNDKIARLMKMPDGAARTAISRAKSDLIAELQRLAPEYFPDPV